MPIRKIGLEVSNRTKPNKIIFKLAIRFEENRTGNQNHFQKFADRFGTPNRVKTENRKVRFGAVKNHRTTIEIDSFILLPRFQSYR